MWWDEAVSIGCGMGFGLCVWVGLSVTGRGGMWWGAVGCDGVRYSGVWWSMVGCGGMVGWGVGGGAVEWSVWCS